MTRHEFIHAELDHRIRAAEMRMLDDVNESFGIGRIGRTARNGPKVVSTDQCQPRFWNQIS
jgi:hypothetical protein